MTNSAASGPQPAVIEVGKDGAARNIAVRARAGGAPGLEESVAVFEQFCAGPQVAIGSSMGGWIALLLARELGRRRGIGRATLAGLGLVAPGAAFHGDVIVE